MITIFNNNSDRKAGRRATERREINGSLAARPYWPPGVAGECRENRRVFFGETPSV